MKHRVHDLVARRALQKHRVLGNLNQLALTCFERSFRPCILRLPAGPPRSHGQHVRRAWPMFDAANGVAETLSGTDHAATRRRGGAYRSVPSALEDIPQKPRQHGTGPTSSPFVSYGTFF